MNDSKQQPNSAQHVSEADALRALVQAATAACDKWDENCERGVPPDLDMAHQLRGVRAVLEELRALTRPAQAESGEAREAVAWMTVDGRLVLDSWKQAYASGGTNVDQFHIPLYSSPPIGENPAAIADEMEAWSEKKMTASGSSRIDRTLVREWAKRLRGEA